MRVFIKEYYLNANILCSYIAVIYSVFFVIVIVVVKEIAFLFARDHVLTLLGVC